jgi:hypothetical protein
LMCRVKLVPKNNNNNNNFLTQMKWISLQGVFVVILEGCR